MRQNSVTVERVGVSRMWDFFGPTPPQKNTVQKKEYLYIYILFSAWTPPNTTIKKGFKDIKIEIEIQDKDWTGHGLDLWPCMQRKIPFID